jgi:class 3 adenylate cyclase
MIHKYFSRGIVTALSLSMSRLNSRRRGRGPEAMEGHMSQLAVETGAIHLNEHLHGETSKLMAAVDRLRRFISPALADLIIRGDEEALGSHRRAVSVVFFDLRRFTRFAELQSPEDVMFVLNGFHQAIGELVAQHSGMLERFTGDGMMVYFNGPIHVRNPELRAVSLAVAAHERVAALAHEWRARGAALALGVGISHGVATVGRIGFEGRYDYAAIGAVTNLAARLCARARAGETLVCHRIMDAIDGLVEADAIGDVHLRGFHQPHTVFSVKGFKAGRKRA